jgi:16S rRNA (uracil1498-N3)-methyltransferase
VPHVFVASVESPELAEEDRHHLERVLRTRVGEEVTVADGRGGWRVCAFGADGALEPTGEVEHRPAPAPPITVAFALTKGEKPEVAVQKLTELGVDRIMPFAAARSVARWEGERAAKHVARLRKVAREAAMQCRRAWLPQVDEVVPFSVAAALPGACLADAGGAPPSLDRPVVLVGPEGGWSDDERAAGLPAVSLGTHVLRAETAAIAAATVLGGLRAGIVLHAGSLQTGVWPRSVD